jgi:hypothetical protein
MLNLYPCNANVYICGSPFVRSRTDAQTVLRFTASLSVELNRVILESHIEKESSAYLNLQNSSTLTATAEVGLRLCH